MKILFSDESLLVIDKPAGLNSIAGGYDRSLPYLRTILEPEYGRLWVVHRLDKETSGVMVLARSASVHRALNEQFSHRQVQKHYRALVFGDFPALLQVSAPLRRNGDRQHRTVVDFENGKPASTDFSLGEECRPSAALVIASPHTGYTHQIRAHLLSAGFPILADPLYGSAESRRFSIALPILRTALHASRITFIHPLSGTEVTFEAELPEDFLKTIDFLKQTK